MSGGVHSVALSYTFGSMKCDSRASFLARTFASPCLGHEPKAKVMTLKIIDNLDKKIHLNKNHYQFIILNKVV